MQDEMTMTFSSPARMGGSRPADAEGASRSDANEGDDTRSGERNWMATLQDYKLSEKLADYVNHGVCLSDGDHGDWNTNEGRRRLKLFIKSAGLFNCAGPLLYSLYGSADILQALTRLCGLYKGTYMLRTAPRALLLRPKPDRLAEEDGAHEDPEACESKLEVGGVELSTGDIVKAKLVIASPDYGLELEHPDATPIFSKSMAAHVVAILAAPLLQESGIAYAVAPSGRFSGIGRPVHILQIDSATGCCPKGYYVLYMAQVLPATGSQGAGYSTDSCKLPQDFREVELVLNSLLQRKAMLDKCVMLSSYVRVERVSGGEDYDGYLAGQLLHKSHAPSSIDQREDCPGLSLPTTFGIIRVPDPATSPLFASSEVDVSVRISAMLLNAERCTSMAKLMPKPQHVAEEETKAMQTSSHYADLDMMSEAFKGLSNNEA
eukprot:GHVU01005260.1.p1 GENE.GHVU01005260.1~~GHVU01005260.1.p1  ORF type:complete len:506 (+),score=42.80 GHVU01005260.1:217-1518(+)